jgi:hypothetical protein
LNSLRASLVRDVGVAGSNPATPTITKPIPIRPPRQYSAALEAAIENKLRSGYSNTRNTSEGEIMPPAAMAPTTARRSGARVVS